MWTPSPVIHARCVAQTITRTVDHTHIRWITHTSSAGRVCSQPAVGEGNHWGQLFKLTMDCDTAAGLRGSPDNKEGMLECAVDSEV